MFPYNCCQLVKKFSLWLEKFSGAVTDDCCTVAVIFHKPIEPTFIAPNKK